MTDELIAALQAAADAMRRSDPTYCAAMDVAHVSDVEFDAALARVEDALDAVREAASCG